MGLKFYEIGDVPDKNVADNPPEPNFNVRFSPIMYNPNNFTPFRRVIITFNFPTEMAADITAYAPLDTISELKMLLMEQMNDAVDRVFLNHPDVHHQNDDDIRRQLSKIAPQRIIP